MIQKERSFHPHIYTFQEQKKLDHLLFLNEHHPTMSHYPVRLLRMKEKRLVPSNYTGRRWYLCPNCQHVFLEALGDYSYTFRPHPINLMGTYFTFDHRNYKKSIHCCSKECLARTTVKFALKSLTDEGKEYIHTRKIRFDIHAIIKKFH